MYINHALKIRDILYLGPEAPSFSELILSYFNHFSVLLNVSTYIVYAEHAHYRNMLSLETGGKGDYATTQSCICVVR